MLVEKGLCCEAGGGVGCGARSPGTLTASWVNEAPQWHQVALCFPPLPPHPSLMPTLLPGTPREKDMHRPHGEP